MKKPLFVLIAVICSLNVTAQNWELNGNNINATNYLGTKNNFSLFTRTAGINRTKLNHNVAYAINGHNANRNGYLLLGHSQTYSASLFGTGASGAFSLLHLNGDDGTFVQEGGYRPWMRTGITFTSNNDLMYVGHRKEAVIS
jgi:hypothetical protein